MRRLILLFGCMVTCAFAEIFNFIDIPMPAIRTLEGFYFFYVYSTAVGPQNNPSTSVTFKNFEVKWSDGKAGIGDYNGLQVSLIPWGNFSDLVDNAKFCSRDGTLTLRQGAEVSVFTVGKTEQADFPITKTDAYILVVTNCGLRNGATFTKGQVIVKSEHGYLPANQMWTFQWWGWFTLINTFICVMWVIAAASHYKTLVYIQKCITACAMIALLEAATSYSHYQEWNGTGTQNRVIMWAMMLFYSLKCVFTLRMLLETASGPGVSMERFQIDLVCILFFMFQWQWKVIVSNKYRFMVASSFLLAVTIPGTLLWVFLFVWLYRKFHQLLLQMGDKKLGSEVVILFTNIRRVLVVTIALATVVLLIQMADIVVPATPWNLQWLPYDASPHSVYTLFLLAMMILWRPNGNSWQLGYSEQVNQDENEGLHNETRGDCKVHPEQLGVVEA